MGVHGCNSYTPQGWMTAAAEAATAPILVATARVGDTGRSNRSLGKQKGVDGGYGGGSGGHQHVDALPPSPCLTHTITRRRAPTHTPSS